MVEHYNSKSAFANYLQKFQSAEQQRNDGTIPPFVVKMKSNAAFKHFASRSEEVLKSSLSTDTETELPQENGEKQADSARIRQWPHLQGTVELGTNKPIPSLLNKSKASLSENNSPTSVLPPKVRNSSDGSLSTTISSRRQVFESHRFESSSENRTRIFNSTTDTTPSSKLSKSESTTSSNWNVNSVQSSSVGEEMNCVYDDRLDYNFVLLHYCHLGVFCAISFYLVFQWSSIS